MNVIQAAAFASVKYMSTGEYYDQIITGRRTVAALEKYGAVQKANSWDFRVPIGVLANPTVQSRAFWDPITPNESNEFQYLDYEPRLINGVFGVSVGEALANQGPEQVISIFKGKQRMLADTVRQKTNQFLFSGDGTITTNPHGFTQLISTSGSVGGLSRSTYSSLQSTVDGSGGAVNPKIWDKVLDTISASCGFVPNLIICPTLVKAKYMDLTRTFQSNIKDQRLADLGWLDGANHRGIPIIDDNDATAGETWFINTDYLNWLQLKGGDPRVTSNAELPTQSVYYVKYEMYGNMITKMPRSCGWIANQTT